MRDFSKFIKFLLILLCYFSTLKVIKYVTNIFQIPKNLNNMKKQQIDDRHRSVSENTAEYYQDIDTQIYQIKPESKILHLQDEIFNLKKSIKSRDDEITKLKREIHKLKVYSKIKLL